MHSCQSALPKFANFLQLCFILLVFHPISTYQLIPPPPSLPLNYVGAPTPLHCHPFPFVAPLSPLTTPQLLQSSHLSALPTTPSPFTFAPASASSALKLHHHCTHQERRKKEDRQRQLEMESFSRVSLRLGGQRRSDEPKEPKEPKASRGRSGYGAGYINYRSARTTPGAGYKSPYAQQPYHPLRSRTKSPSKPKRTRTTTPTAPHTNASGVSIVGGASSPPKPTTADNRSADTAVNLRDLTRLNKPSYCGTDYYFKNGDPRDMGHDKYKSKGAVPFGKLSKGRPFTYESPLDAKLGDPVHYSPADTR